MNKKLFNRRLPLILALLFAGGVASAYVYANANVYRMPVSSMEPTFMAGDNFRVNSDAYQTSEPARWDVVAFRSPQEEEKTWLFRIVGLPGEIISFANNGVTIDGASVNLPIQLDGVAYAEPKAGVKAVQYPFAIPNNRYFVLGDNPDKANDSRYWGTIARDDILGSVNP